MGLFDVLPIGTPSLLVACIVVSSYGLLAVIDLIIIYEVPLPKTVKHYLLSVPTAIISIFFYIMFPKIRVWMVGVPIAWGFANWVLRKIQTFEGKMVKKET